MGCVLSFTDDPLFVKEQASLMDELIASEDMKRELLNLQKQMFNCMDAERDNDKIQRDIMPNIMKNPTCSSTVSAYGERERRFGKHSAPRCR